MENSGYSDGDELRTACSLFVLVLPSSSETEASFLDLHLSILDGFISYKIYHKHDEFDFDIVNFPYLDGDVPRPASYGGYISQLIRFASVQSYY